MNPIKALQGEGSHFLMNTTTTEGKGKDKVGELWVVKELDFEEEEFYLLSINVKVL